MDDSDDYDFGSVQNSNLSSIFGRDNLSEATNDSLVYKAPKQPISAKEPRASAPNYYYNYINLYEIVGDVQQNLGKHIICLLKSETNTPKILIYQNRKNILIRNSIETISIFIDTERKNNLNISANKRNFSMEYTQVDYDNFISEFTNIGGTIKNKTQTDKKDFKHTNPGIPEKNNLPLLHPTTVLSSLTNSGSNLDAIGVEENNSPEAYDNKEKEVILARLAKMGLPQLPTVQRDVTDNNNIKIRTDAIKEKNIPFTNSNSRIEKIEELEKAENNSELAVFNPESALIPQKIEDSHTQMLNRPIDPISFMLAENRLNNAELRHQISLLTSSMTKMNTEPLQNKTDDKLKSKLRAYQMRSENLESELNRLKKKYAELQSLNGELSEKVNNSEATHGINQNNSTGEETEINILKSNFKQLLEFIQNLPLRSTEIDLSILEAMKENIQDDEIRSSLENSVLSIQKMLDFQRGETENRISKMRTDYMEGTRQIMFELYSKILNLCPKMKKELSRDFRSSNLELETMYDDKIHNTIGRFC